MAFSFEKLEVYQLSLNWVSGVNDISQKLRKIASYPLLDQLQRAALSIPLNIAEGSGRWHKKEKRQFLYIARGSVYESVPIIQVLLRKNFIEQKEYNEYYDELTKLSKMLTSLIKSLENLN